MPDLNNVTAGEYELVAELFDQRTSPLDKPFTFTRYTRGERVVLDEADAKRLVAAGAVVVPGELQRAVFEAAKAQYEAALAALALQAPPEPPQAPEPPAEKPLQDKTVPELQAFAQTEGIDLGDAKKKDDILAKIAAAQRGE